MTWLRFAAGILLAALIFLSALLCVLQCVTVRCSALQFV